MGRKKIETKVVLQNCLGGVEAKTARTWFRGIFLQIPALPPSGLSNSTLIDISYKLKVKFFASGQSRYKLKVYFRLQQSQNDPI
jgi:hypothetical protein